VTRPQTPAVVRFSFFSGYLGFQADIGLNFSRKTAAQRAADASIMPQVSAGNAYLRLI
jgi:hypothetical protein